jgi:hypothetical protein
MRAGTPVIAQKFGWINAFGMHHKFFSPFARSIFDIIRMNHIFFLFYIYFVFVWGQGRHCFWVAFVVAICHIVTFGSWERVSEDVDLGVERELIKNVIYICLPKPDTRKMVIFRFFHQTSRHHVLLCRQKTPQHSNFGIHLALIFCHQS